MGIHYSKALGDPTTRHVLIFPPYCYMNWIGICWLIMNLSAISFVDQDCYINIFNYHKWLVSVIRYGNRKCKNYFWNDDHSDHSVVC